VATRQELKGLATLRLREAEALFDAGLYDGAAYLCGYVVELALKARICRLLGTDEYPSTGEYKRVYAVHDLGQLLFLAGLQSKMKADNQPLFTNWSITVPWNPESRYRPEGSVSRKDALAILNAIRDPRDGVLRWLKKQW
jgi:HEPN domain-containing protein